MFTNYPRICLSSKRYKLEIKNAHVYFLKREN